MRLPRFGLRAIFIAVTVGAVIFWGYWIGWPGWKLYLQESRFVAQVNSVKAGTTVRELRNSLDSLAQILELPVFTSEFLFDVNPRRAANVRTFAFGDRLYCVVIVIDGEQHTGNLGNDKLTRIELIDLSLPPADYNDTWMPGSRPVRIDEQQGSVGTAALDQLYISYLSKFARFIYEDRTNNPGFKYKLIYSDQAQ